MFKTINRSSPNYLHNRFQYVKDKHQINTRSAANGYLSIPRLSSKTGQRSFQYRGMLVKKGQNIKIINLHDKTVIYTSRFVYVHQDSYIYIKIRIYTSRFVYIQQDLYIYIKIRTYTSRFVYIHQDSYIYSKIRIYTARFVDSYIYIKIRIYTSRFVHIHQDSYIYTARFVYIQQDS